MEEKPPETIDDPREALKPMGGRDELNLAEFPITLLSDRVPKGCKTLVFEVDSRDRKMGKVIPRKVTITGSDAYGLPTAIDDEILVGLIQLTKLKSDFTEPLVSFSRYELLKLLGWPDDGRSYRRIEESIRRWTGVTLYYENAWRDQATKTWVSENFHIIERSSLIDSETKRARRSQGQYDLALSSFRWSEIVFQSFQAGSLKRLDIEAYFSYSTSIAKRMYRFLDKRFYLNDRWEFDLKEFAFNHIGLSTKYNVAQIKNKLQPAIEELSQDTAERAAFIEPMDPKLRYKKVSKGEWLIIVSRRKSPCAPVASTPAPAPSPPEPQGLVAELIKRGVSHEVAAELVNTSAPELIKTRIDVHDYDINKHKHKNPVGFLVASIRGKYETASEGFISKAELAKRKEAEQQKERSKAEARRLKAEAEAREEGIKKQIDAYWDSLDDLQREKLIAEALEQADEQTRETYLKQLPSFKKHYLRSIRDSYIRSLLNLPPAT